MRNILVLAQHELKKYGKSKGFLLYAVFIISLFTGIEIFSLREFLTQEELKPVLIPMVLTYLSTSPFLFTLLLSTFLIQPAIHTEKVSKRLLFLLSSPLKTQEIWLGKTLALYLLGLMAGILGTIVKYFGIQVFLDLKIDLSLDIIGWIFYNATVMPLATLSLVTLLSLLIKRSDIVVSLGMMIVIFFFVALGFVLPEIQQNLAYLQKLNYLAGAIIVVIPAISAKFLNKEKVARTFL